DRDVAVVVAAGEQRLERDLQVLELLVRQLEPGAEPADDEVRDVVEVLLRRQDERDLVAHGRSSPASRSSSSSSRSRCAEAALPACTAWRQSRFVLKSAAP